MILSNNAIQRLLENGTIKIEPEAVLKEAAIKLHLSEEKNISLKPKEFTTALTKEKITLPQEYAAFYDGYTHLARIGLMTHMGSMFVYPGVAAHQITLEMYNASEKQIILKAGSRVGHLVIMEVKLQ